MTLERNIFDQYGFEVLNLSLVPTGVGGLTYHIETAADEYILKVCHPNEYVQNEPDVAKHLQEHGLPVTDYIPTRSNRYFWDYNGDICLLQRYVQGKIMEYNSSPDWFMIESAQLLGKMHAALSSYKPLPVGMGEGFLSFMKSGRAKNSYLETLEKSKALGDKIIEGDVAYRLTQVDRLNEISFDLSKLTCRNTHGDYKISNILCKDDKIAAIIDLSGACVHPIVWEIIRSFTYADSACVDGTIDFHRFNSYLQEYLRYASLNHYDLRMMPYFLLHQLLACDYYAQYYNATGPNREDFLHQAIFATKLIRWFEIHIEDLSNWLSTALSE